MPARFALLAARKAPSARLVALRSSTPSRRSLWLSATGPRLSPLPMAAQSDTSATVVAASSSITPESLSATLRQKINATHVEIEDMSGGCGQAFNAIIVSPEFEKKNLLARHRLVNNALREEIAAIHAWTPRCLTPEQWEKEKQKLGI